MNDDIKEGAEIEIGYPFVMEDFEGYDGDGPFKTKSWRPGTRGEMIAPDDADMVADGIGSQIMKVVSIHKPGKYPARVFFTRRWRAPNGAEFGKTKLCMTTLGCFRIRCRGYRHHYRLSETSLAVSSNK